MIRLLTFLLLAVLSFPGWGALLYEQDWEATAITRIPVKGALELAPGAFTGTKCYQTANYGFESWATSTKYSRNGSRSLRNENHTYLKHGESYCTLPSEGKSRQEVVYGYDVPRLGSPKVSMPNGFLMGQERWIGLSYYYPSDEGTIANWWDDGDPRMNILQLMDYGNSFTPSVFILLSRNGQVDVQSWYSTGATSENKVGNTPFGVGYFKKDQWNDLVVRVKRGWNNDGILQVWVNKVLVTNLVNKSVSIRDKPYAYFAAGQYWADKGTTGINNNIRVQYVDNIKIGDETSSYAEVDPASGTTQEPECPPDCPTNGAITGVNGGAIITNNQAQVPFTASTAESILGCNIGSLPERHVNWNYATNASGIFAAGDVTGLASSSQTLKCYSEPHLTPLTVLNTIWGAAGTATDAAFSGNKFGYTAGVTLTRPDTENYSYTGHGPGAEHYTKAVVGDKMKFDFTYSCTGVSCENLYFAVIDDEATVPSNDMRNTAEGTAGALVPGVLNGGHGSWLTGANRVVVNRTLGDDVYRVTIPFTVTNPSAYFKWYFGYKGGPAGKSVTLHEVIPRKNVATKTLTYPVLVQVATTDTIPPTVDQCTITSVPAPEPEVTPTPYTATVTCNTTELGGDYFVMLKDTNAAPANADAVIAGTGALRSATGPVDSLSITAEFSGLSYQDLWGWIVHKDAADKVSAVASVSFDDGVTTGVKRIKFANSATRLRTRDGATFGGALDFFTLHPTDPRLPGPKTDLVYIDNPTITAGIPNFTEADTQCETCSGSINALPLGQYWYSARSEDGTVKSVNTINIVDAAE